MTLLQKTFRVNGKILRKILVGLSFSTILTIHAQSTVVIASDTLNPQSLKKEMAIGLNLGISNGVGVDFAYRLAKHWTGRIAYNYADYTKKDYTYDITSTSSDGTKTIQKVSFDAGVKLSNLALNMEFTPGTKGRFKLIGGLSYFPTNEFTVSGEMASTIKFNDVVLNPEDLGSGIVTIGYKQKIAPFIGLGFGRTFPRKRINVSFDMGSYYKGDYKVAINVNPGALLEENESNAAILERNLNQKWNQKLLPVFNFRIGYRLQ